MLGGLQFSSISSLYSQCSPRINAKLAGVVLNKNTKLADFGSDDKKVLLAELLRVGNQRAIDIIKNSSATDLLSENFFKHEGVQKSLLAGVMNGTLTDSSILDRMASCDVALSESDGTSIWHDNSAVMLSLVNQRPEVLLVLRFLKGDTAQSVAEMLIKNLNPSILASEHFHAFITNCDLKNFRPSEKAAFLADLKATQKTKPSIELDTLIEKLDPTKTSAVAGSATKKATTATATATATATTAGAKNTITTAAMYLVSVIAVFAAVMHRKELFGLAGVVSKMPLKNLGEVGSQLDIIKNITAAADPRTKQLQVYVSPHTNLSIPSLGQESGSDAIADPRTKQLQVYVSPHTNLPMDGVGDFNRAQFDAFIRSAQLSAQFYAYVSPHTNSSSQSTDADIEQVAPPPVQVLG